MLQGENGVYLDEVAASVDITTLIQARNLIELAIGDVDNILGELQPMEGNTKDVLQDDANLLKKQLTVIMEQITQNINTISGIVERYKEIDQKLKLLAAQRAVSAVVSATNITTNKQVQTTDNSAAAIKAAEDVRKKLEKALKGTKK